MQIKATIVSENCVYHLPGAVAEHGLSIFLETDRGNYLLDTGQGKAVVNNALVLGLDLTTIKGIILSHHHWDHTGGLGPVLDLKGAVHVPRGFLEFQADPTSPTHKPQLGGNKKLVLYCGSGNRSVLGAKTLKSMGIVNVAHVAGGFAALQQAGGTTEQ